MQLVKLSLASCSDLLARDTSSKARRMSLLRAHRTQKKVKARVAHILIANPALLSCYVRDLAPVALEEATDDVLRRGTRRRSEDLSKGTHVA